MYAEKVKGDITGPASVITWWSSILPLSDVNGVPRHNLVPPDLGAEPDTFLLHQDDRVIIHHGWGTEHMWVAGGDEVWCDAARRKGDVKGWEAAGRRGGATSIVHGVHSEVERAPTQKGLVKQWKQNMKQE